MGNNDYLRQWNKNKVANLLLTAFFIVSFIEVTAEYNEDKYLIWLTKPLILPLLMAYYIRRSAKVNVFFLVALLFCWLTNLFFIENTWSYILLGTVSFIIYRILVIGIVLKKVKMPSFLPLIIGSIPFLFIYASVAIFTFSALGDSLYLFLVQSVFTIFLGGLSLGNYIMSSNKSNRTLFLSTILFAFNQLVFLLRFYYEEANLLQSISIILFVWAQYLLTKYMLITEKQKSRYLIVSKLNEVG